MKLKNLFYVSRIGKQCIALNNNKMLYLSNTGKVISEQIVDFPLRGSQMINNITIEPHMFQTVYGNGEAVIAVKNKLFKFCPSGLEFIVEVPNTTQLLFQWFFVKNQLHIYHDSEIYKVSEDRKLIFVTSFKREFQPYFIQYGSQIAVLYNKSKIYSAEIIDDNFMSTMIDLHQSNQKENQQLEIIQCVNGFVQYKLTYWCQTIDISTMKVGEESKLSLQNKLFQSNRAVNNQISFQNQNQPNCLRRRTYLSPKQLYFSAKVSHNLFFCIYDKLYFFDSALQIIDTYQIPKTIKIRNNTLRRPWFYNIILFQQNYYFQYCNVIYQLNLQDFNIKLFVTIPNLDKIDVESGYGKLFIYNDNLYVSSKENIYLITDGIVDLVNDMRGKANNNFFFNTENGLFHYHHYNTTLSLVQSLFQMKRIDSCEKLQYIDAEEIQYVKTMSYGYRRYTHSQIECYDICAENHCANINLTHALIDTTWLKIQHQSPVSKQLLLSANAECSMVSLIGQVAMQKVVRTKVANIRMLLKRRKTNLIWKLQCSTQCIVNDPLESQNINQCSQ